MSAYEIVARIMYDVESLCKYFPLRDIEIVMTLDVFTMVKEHLRNITKGVMIPGRVTMYGVPVEVINAKGGKWYVALKGTVPKEEA